MAAMTMTMTSSVSVKPDSLRRIPVTGVDRRTSDAELLRESAGIFRFGALLQQVTGQLAGVVQAARMDERVRVLDPGRDRVGVQPHRLGSPLQDLLLGCSARQEIGMLAVQSRPLVEIARI